MSTNLVTFASDETTMRFREPYLTQGLNRKAVVNARGTYRGFRLAEDPGAGDRTILIQADPTELDHLLSYHSTSGYALTVRKSGGDFLLSLSAYSSVTVVIAIYASYAVSATTAAMIRAYTEAEYAVAAEKDELVVLGRVVVPVSGAIAAASITGDGRTMAWAERASESVGWAPVLRNTSFEWTPNSAESLQPYAMAYWVKPAGSNGTVWGRGTTGPRSGTFCLSYAYPAAADTTSVYQHVNVPMVEGQRVRIRFYKRMIQAALSGTFTVLLEFVDNAGAVISTTAPTIDTAIDADYEEFDKVFEAPANARYLRRIGIQTTAITFGAASEAIRVDDFEAWVETSAEDFLPQDSRKGFDLMTLLQLVDPTGTPAELSALLRMDKSTPSGEGKVVGQSPLSGNPPALEWLGRLIGLGGGLVGSAANAALPRIQTTVATEATTKYTLLWEVNGTGGFTTRVYSAMNTADGGGIAITTNAYWTGTQWNRDSADESGMLLVGRNGLEYRFHSGGGGAPWNQTAWTSTGLSIPSEVPGSSVLDLELGPGPLRLGGYLTGQGDWDTPRLQIGRIAEATSVRTLLFQSSPPSVAGSQAITRIYRYFDAGLIGDALEITTNCYWTGTVWTADNATVPASAFRISALGFNSVHRYSTGTTWNDSSGWTDDAALYMTSAYRAFVVEDGSFASSTVSNPAATTEIHNEVIAKTMIKVLGKITLNASASPTIADGINLTSVSADASDITVTVNQDFAGSGYTILAMVEGINTSTEAYTITTNNQASGSFKLRMRDSGGTLVPPNTATGYSIYFLAVGAQP